MRGCCRVVCGLLLVVLTAEASTVYQAASVSRHQEGDSFLLKRDGAPVACSRTLCGDSHAVPAMIDSPKCACRCPPESPVFREDLHVCVDDLHECSLVTFKNGAKLQKVPFVFLPMKGQIIHPSSDIIFAGAGDEDPVCVVSSAQFLTRNGWIELRNTSDTEPPLRLFRDHRRTFLQWVGEQDLRLGMEGRVLMARLMCKDANGLAASSNSGVVTHAFSTPCVAFRVAGSQGAREVMFTSDYTVAATGGLLHGLLGGSTELHASSGLSTSEGIAVGVCVLLLGLVYAASVCVFLHVRRRRRRKRKKRTGLDDSLSSDSERGVAHAVGGTELEMLGEGVVKNNPLLSQYSSRVRRSFRACNDAVQSDEEDDQSERSVESDHNNKLVTMSTKVTVERHKLGPAPPAPPKVPTQNSSGIYTLTLQSASEGGSMERHPEESVSIVETLDDAEPSTFARARDFSFLGGRPSMTSSSLGLPGLSGCERGCASPTNSAAHNNPFLASPGTSTRRKLYFNPAYFETEMLHAPPPAALEFLQKLREVITMSKHKMLAKRFTPSLLGIPEEQGSLYEESGEARPTSQSSYEVTDRTASRSSYDITDRTASRSSYDVADRVDSFYDTASPNKLEIDEARTISHKHRHDTMDEVTGSKQQTIRRWLADLESGDPVEEEQIEETQPPQEPVAQPVAGVQPKRLMDAVIKELVRERGLEAPSHDYETVQPAAPPPQASPSATRPPLMMYCLPELLAKTTGYNLVSEVYVNDGYSSNQSSASRASGKKLQRPLRGSAGSSSPRSSLSEPAEDEGTARLTIEVPEPPHVLGYESDEFEPDTLDRGKVRVQPQRLPDVCVDSLERPMKILLKASGSFFKDATSNAWHGDVWNCKKQRRTPSSIADLRSPNIQVLADFPSPQVLQKNFGSLREIFEAKRQQKQVVQHEARRRGVTRSLVEPHELRWRNGLTQQMVDEIREMMWKATPECPSLPRVSPTKPRRQRSADVSATPPTPPPSVPPSNPPTLPPKQRKINPPEPSREVKPPPSLPPKNVLGSRSPSNRNRSPSPGASAHHSHPTHSHVLSPTPPHRRKQGAHLHSPPACHRLAATSHKHAVSHGRRCPNPRHPGSEEEEEQSGSCTLGRKVENCLNDAFSRNVTWQPEVKISHRPGDSGYLSSDSGHSANKESSETEESLCDAGSESGAESIGTDSFFYGKVRDDPRFDFAPGSTVIHMQPPLKKKPPPPPKRVNSRLETSLTSKYAL